MKFKGEVALITGGGTGIGRAITEKLLHENLKTVIFSRSKGKKAAEELGPDCSFYSVDITDYDAVEEAMGEVIEDHGRLDYLVNNAGMRNDQLLMRMKPENWESSLKVNLSGVYNCTQNAIRYLLKSDGSAILNVSSIAGIYGSPGQSNYSAAKAGVIGFTKALSKEYGSRGLRANVIAPGFVETRMTEDLSEERKLEYLEAISLERYGKPEEIAETAVFLLSDNARSVSGALLKVDGGFTGA